MFRGKLVAYGIRLGLEIKDCLYASFGVIDFLFAAFHFPQVTHAASRGSGAFPKYLICMNQ
jgi:hypothetical protein